MYPIDLARDVQFHNFGAPKIALDSSGVSLVTPPKMRSNGVIYQDHADFYVWESKNIASNRMNSAGIYFKMNDIPEEDGFIHFAINGHAGTQGLNLRPIWFLGIGPATPADSAGGQSLAFPRPLVAGESQGAQSQANIGTVVAVRRPGTIAGTDYSERPLAIGVAFASNLSDPATQAVWASVSVQRLVGSPPPFIDRRIG